MAYASSIAAPRQFVSLGLYATPSTGAEISKGGSAWVYCSSHGAADITGAGFFAKAGGRPLLWPTMTPGSSENVGMRVGDLVVNIESSAGASPGRVTWHCVTASTFSASTGSSGLGTGGAGFNVTVSAAATT